MIVLPKILVQIALWIVVIRSGYVAFHHINTQRHKSWLDIAFHISVAIVAFYLL